VVGTSFSCGGAREREGWSSKEVARGMEVERGGRVAWAKGFLVSRRGASRTGVKRSVTESRNSLCIHVLVRTLRR